MNTINISYMAGAYSNSTIKQEVKNNQTEAVSFLDKAAEKSESVVEQYKKKNPKDASHVDAQVRAGKSVIVKNGVDNVSREDMTMDEYKRFINGLLKTIPFDATRIYDKEIISISEAGWKQMKNDPDYEAWVLGYTVENRSVRNPFFGLPGASGSFGIEKFGASIEEHMGQGFSMSGPGSTSKHDKNEKSWWEKRQEKMEERLKEQAENALKKAQKQRALEHKFYLSSSLASRQRLHSFLTEGTKDSKDTMEFQATKMNALMAMAYENNISIFSRSIMESKKR